MKKSFWEGWGATTNPPNIQENKQIATTSDSKSCLSYAFFLSCFLAVRIFFIIFIFLAKLQTNKFHKMPKGEQYYCKVTHNRNKAVNIGPQNPVISNFRVPHNSPYLCVMYYILGTNPSQAFPISSKNL